MDVTTASLLAAAVLAGVFALGVGSSKESAEASSQRQHWLVVSAAAGISVAYVFVDLLPELAAQNRVLRAAGGESRLFAEQRIYVLALLSFVVMYGLEHLVLARREQRRHAIEHRQRDVVYWLHLIGFAAYGALIGSLLVDREERGPLSLALYTFAMAVHFVVVNHSLSEQHGELYRRHGRWLLAASVLVGWWLGRIEPLSDAVFARLFALLAGGVVITSLRAELPDDRRGRFWPFCISAIGFSALLMFA
jgi:hypothetical protein